MDNTVPPLRNNLERNVSERNDKPGQPGTKNESSKPFAPPPLINKFTTSIFVAPPPLIDNKLARNSYTRLQAVVPQAAPPIKHTPVLEESVTDQFAKVEIDPNS